MNSTPASQKVCCTCEYFGGTSKKCGSSSVQWEGSNHVCKISGRGNGTQSSMNSACSKWTPKK